MAAIKFSCGFKYWHDVIKKEYVLFAEADVTFPFRGVDADLQDRIFVCWHTRLQTPLAKSELLWPPRARQREKTGGIRQRGEENGFVDGSEELP